MRSSRWVDYDTHELLEMISELEDERRWARLREGFWLAFSFTSCSALRHHLDSELRLQGAQGRRPVRRHQAAQGPDLPRPAARRPAQAAAKVALKPLPKQPLIDKKTLEEMKREAPPVRRRRPSSTRLRSSPSRSPRSPFRPTRSRSRRLRRRVRRPFPPRPNFAMGSQNPADQLRQDMQNAMHNHGQQGSNGIRLQAACPCIPAPAPAARILSDTQGVDFSSWLARWHYMTAAAPGTR